MRKVCLSLSSLAACAVALPVQVSGFYPFESGELFLTAEPQIQYDSNIYGNAAEEGDWLARVPVGLLVIRDAGHIRAEASAGVEFGFFKEFTAEDYEDPYVRGSLRYQRDGHPLLANLGLGWWKETLSDALVQDRTRVERRRVELDGRYRTHRRLGLRGGASYNHWDYSRGFLSQRDQWGLRAGAEYSYSPRLDIGLNYGYTRSEIDSGGIVDRSSDDHALFFSLEGQLSPRVSQSVDLGVKRRSFADDTRSSDTQPYAAISLIWEASEVTTYRLSGVADFSFSPDNESLSQQRVELSWRRQIDPKIALSAAVHYAQLEFQYGDAAQVNRDDDEIGGRVALEYVFTRLMSGRLEAMYLTRSSTTEYADYDRYVFGATFRIQY